MPRKPKNAAPHSPSRHAPGASEAIHVEATPRAPAGLNPAQQRAVQCLSGPLLVIAGAGTGKTRTLIHRLAALIQSGVPPESILLLTFTRRAAQEMIDRATALLDQGCGRISGGTFHGFANLMLRRLVPELRDCTIIDQSDSFEIIGELRAELGLGARGKSFPRKETLAAILSKAANFEVSITDVVKGEYPHLITDIPLFKQLGQRYAEFKQARKLLDYDDLLIELARRLENDAHFRHRVTERYHYILVDEYQDTNIPQARITRLLAGERRNVMVVGDDAQSIYAFRGARAANLFEFHDEFKDATHITLEENYRSTQPILDVANALLEQMSRTFRKRLFTSRQGGEVPLLVTARDEEEQARYVARQIGQLLAQGLRRAEIAVLFRASSHAYALELELSRLKLPYVKYGGFRFMEAAHIKDVLAHLRVLHNPADDLSLTRVLLLCPKVGAQGARKIREAVAGKPLGEALQGHKATGDAKEGLSRLGGLFSRLHLARESGATPAALLTQVCDHYVPSLKQNFEDAERRQRDLEQLVDLCQDYRSLESMLTDLSLQPPNTSRNEGLAAADAGSLVLSTIHSAKGLEWKAVFIIQAIDGAIPMFSAFGDGPDQEQLDEELRLLYVAVTRAQDQLCLVWPASTRRQFEWVEVSRFLAAVPAKLLTRVRATGEGRA